MEIEVIMCPDNANPTGMWMLAVPASPAMGATFRARALDKEGRLGHYQRLDVVLHGQSLGQPEGSEPRISQACENKGLWWRKGSSVSGRFIR